MSCWIKHKKFFFSVSLVEFQLYFTGFLKVYATVLLLKKYLTSKIEKNVPQNDANRFGVFIVNFEHISRLVLVFLLLTLSS